MKTIISSLILLLFGLNAAFAQCNPQLAAVVNGNVVTFTNNSTPNFIVGNYINYDLNFGDGNSSTQSTPWNPVNHQYASNGTYTATLTQTITDSATNNLVCTMTNSVNVVINGAINCSLAPTMSYSTSANNVNTIDFTVNPNITSMPIGFQYNTQINYNYGDGTSGTSSSHQYTASGNYVVVATVNIVDPNNSAIVYCSATTTSTVAFTYTNPCNSNPTFTLAYTSGNNISITGINQANYVSGYQYSYLFDFGDGTNYTTQYIGNYYSHFYPNAGTYNVCITETITDSLTNTVLCTNTSCNIATIATTVPVYSGCDANYTFSPDTINSSLLFYFNGSPSTTSSGTITNYAWDFGDGTTGTGLNTNHTYATAGVYNVCLTITTSTTCSDATCFVVNAQTSSPTNMYTIGGSIFDNNNQLLSGTIVYLIKYDATTQNLSLAQSQIAYGSNYYFHVNPGDYLVKAAMLPSNNAAVLNLAPTYSTSAALWNNATTNSVTNASISAPIYMQGGVNAGGPGFISGSVITGANKTTAIGDPKEGLTVLLINTATNKVFAYTTTDANGDYQFSNVAVGNYKIYIEELGKTMTPKILSISTANASKTDINFESNSAENHPLAPASAEDLNKANASLEIYPNPTNGIMNIRFANKIDNQKTEITVLSIEGKVLLNETKTMVANDVQLNVANLNMGMYILKIKNGESTYVKQFSKY